MKREIITAKDVLINRGTFIKSILITAGGFVLRNYNMAATDIAPKDVLVRMIYNNSGNASGFKKEWGLAMWIEHNHEAVLFDTGGNPGTLWKNIQTAGIDLSKLTAIIISHNHWDHTRGIPVILDKITRKTSLFVPASDRPEMKEANDLVNVIPVTGAQRITGSIWSTGEIKGSLLTSVIYEQSVIIALNNQVFLFTGCAHPGVVAIVEKVKSLFPEKDLALVAGGFHLIDKTPEQIGEISVKLKEMGVKQIAPSHCTGDKAIDWFRTTWQERFVEFNIGDELNL
jgi:7,8-dihydropterin-6-yl-methyl-4-(beta-D-ribofuranosyl)aminobenzene 5'-phosphate synthase